MEQEPIAVRAPDFDAGSHLTTPPQGRYLAVVVFGLATSLYIAGWLLAALGGAVSTNEAVSLAFYAFTVVGYLIAVRRPANAIVWICLGIRPRVGTGACPHSRRDLGHCQPGRRRVAGGARRVVDLSVGPGEMTVLSVVLLVIAGTPAAYLTGSVALRRPVQDRVDRRFNRALYAARREVDRFADRLRDEVELGDLAGDHGGAVAGTLRPAVATIWVRGWA